MIRKCSLTHSEKPKFWKLNIFGRIILLLSILFAKKFLLPRSQVKMSLDEECYHVTNICNSTASLREKSESVLVQFISCLELYLIRYRCILKVSLKSAIFTPRVFQLCQVIVNIMLNWQLNSRLKFATSTNLIPN